MPELTLYGPHWSAYTRTARLTLHEKRVPYQLVEVDFASGSMPQAHLARHPFAKVPVLDHHGFALYETSAICRYIDSAFAGPALQPDQPQAIGRMAQVIAILDNYLSNEIRMGFTNEVTIKPMAGLASDKARVAKAQREITKGFNALAACCSHTGEFLMGEQLTLADLHAAPLFDFLCAEEAGKALVAQQPLLASWWGAMATRPSLRDTAVDLSVFQRS